MDRTQACGACDRGSIPLEGVDTIKPPVFRGLYGIYVYIERNRTGILKRECLHVLKTQGSEGARSLPQAVRSAEEEDSSRGHYSRILTIN